MLVQVNKKYLYENESVTVTKKTTIKNVWKIRTQGGRQFEVHEKALQELDVATIKKILDEPDN